MDLAAAVLSVPLPCWECLLGRLVVRVSIAVGAGDGEAVVVLCVRDILGSYRY
jgi:hypothetical protein